MSEITREMHASQSSVEISINAKGLWSAKVKAYADTLEAASELAEQKAVELESKINSRNTIT